MSERIKFVVYGKAQTAGSKRAFPFKKKNGKLGVAVSDDNARSKDWKQLVAFAAQQHRPESLLVGPLSVRLTFVRERPGGHFNSKGALNKKGSASQYPTQKPDVLKLARAVEDALTSVLWKDDSQIVEERISKRWGETPCVQIIVEELAWETEQLQTA